MSGTADKQPSNERQPLTKIEQRAGDQSYQFGQVLGDVSIEKVYQLLSPTSVVIILAAIAIVVTGSFYLYRLAQKPSRMTGDFNIAVARFGEVTEQGLASSTLATQLSKMLFDFLDSEYKATDFGLDVQVAHRKLPVLTEDREAEQLAQDINADVVIYGSMYVLGNEARLDPRFYVANQPDTSELAGPHRFGVPVEFDTTSLDLYDKVNLELQPRAAILVHFTEGLAYFSGGHYQEASHIFRRAVREAESYQPFDGQEVIYVFAAQADCVQGNYEQAMTYLDRALELNPEYARAYIARGNVYYTQAVESAYDVNKLSQALAEYEHAIQAEDQQPGAYVREKANVAMGNVYVIRAQQTHDPAMFEQAIDHYSQVIGEYEETKGERIRQLAAIAYFGLGAAYERQHSYAQAEEAYQRCAEIATDADLRSRAENQLEVVVQ